MNDPTTPLKRTQDEIVARIEAVKDEDFFGFRLDVLMAALDFEHARPYLKSDITADDWESIAVCACEFEQDARDYYEFALTKIDSHRGISATRSVDKLGEYAWLLSRDEVVAAMDAADYTQYGAPKVKAFGAGFGLAWPDDRAMQRMAEGLPCTDECSEGCSW